MCANAANREIEQKKAKATKTRVKLLCAVAD